MNGMWGDVYWTMHVTPESQCSYASLETNVPVSSYSAIISRVIEAFKPKRFQTIQFIDDDSHLGLAMASDASLLAPAVMQGYAITNVSVNQYGPGYVIQMVHYVGLG
jgi:S-adenosylmethionine decarboxylase